MVMVSGYGDCVCVRISGEKLWLQKLIETSVMWRDCVVSPETNDKTRQLILGRS